jgi:hypothetical protein
MDRQRRPASPRSAEAIDTVAVAVAVAVDAGQVQVQSSSSPTIGGTNFRDHIRPPEHRHDSVDLRRRRR